MNEKRRNNDNGIRKYIPNPNWIVVVLLVLGYVVMLVANIKTIPVLVKDVKYLNQKVITLDANYAWIKEGFEKLERLIKERR